MSVGQSSRGPVTPKGCAAAVSQILLLASQVTAFCMQVFVKIRSANLSALQAALDQRNERQRGPHSFVCSIKAERACREMTHVSGPSILLKLRFCTGLRLVTACVWITHKLQSC